MIVIPAIDLLEGKLVRLEKGDYGKKKSYGLQPLDMAKRFEGAGLTHLHLVDLDGAASGEPKNLKILEEIASKTSLTIDFGGGIKSRESALSAFFAGAGKINCGSLAVKNPSLMERLVLEFQEKIILSADCREEKIAVSGWREDTDQEIFSFLRSYQEKGIRRAVVTDISRDGMLSGPATALYRKILEQCPDLELVASGGVSGKKDLEELSASGCYAAIVGKAYYEGRIGLEEMKECENAG